MGDVRAGVGLGEVRGVRKVGTMMTMSLFLLLFCLFWCVCVCVPCYSKGKGPDFQPDLALASMDPCVCVCVCVYIDRFNGLGFSRFGRVAHVWSTGMHKEDLKVDSVGIVPSYPVVI